MYKSGVSGVIQRSHFVKEHTPVCTGMSGTVKLDHNADRIANYRIWHLPKDSNAYQDFIDVEMIDSIRGVAI